MRDTIAAKEARTVVRALEAALARQQSRLAGEAVRRILARGGERLDQFLHIVHAADLSALAGMLDDDLLEFLRRLLDEPAAPTQEALLLLERLAHEHPTIAADDIDAVTATLRRLLAEQLDGHGALRLAEQRS
jgi:hypothetical protein